MTGRIRKVTIREHPLARVAELVHDERVSRGMSFNAACDAARALRPADAVGPGISKSTWQNVEAGRNVRHVAWADIERLFGWAPGSIRRYVEDNGPEPSTPQPPEVTNDTSASGVQTLVATYEKLTPSEQAIVDALVAGLAHKED